MPDGKVASTTPLVVLTVGDGDFSCSLAILRAYGEHIEQLIATTILPSASDLVETYPEADKILDELNASVKTNVLFGVDATQLHDQLQTFGPFHHILFFHPHLGYDPNADLATRARQHSILLSHFLYSSQQLLHPTWKEASIYLCLCSGQSKRWKLQSLLHHHRLQYQSPPRFVSQPLWPDREASPPLPTTNSNTAVATGWLSQYGYQHQATHPESTQMTTVLNSHYHILAKQQLQVQQSSHSTTPSYSLPSDNTTDEVEPVLYSQTKQGFWQCYVCQEQYETVQEIEQHLSAPALPVSACQAIPVTLEDNRSNKKATSHGGGGSSSSTSAAKKHS